jgi:hypothetical protein
MVLRFQKRDEVDRAAEETQQTRVMVFLLLLFVVITGPVAWFRGESLALYGTQLAWLIGSFFVIWWVPPFYHEFRIRTKEIDGKVSAIEETVNASKEGHAELLERLTAIEDKLDAMQKELESQIESSQ